MTGTGASFGSLTVLNALLCGKGAAIGVTLRTVAEFEPHGGSRDVSILNDMDEDTSMTRICVSRAFDLIGTDEPEDWSLSIRSEIPVSRGMKSSSSACNAIISAMLDEYSIDVPNIDIVRLGVECARSSGVTVTGAFDDACSCHFGGYFITNNENDSVMVGRDFPEVDVLFCVPGQKVRKNIVPEVPTKFKIAGEQLLVMAEDDPFHVMNENGKIVSKIMGLDNSVAELALEHGALAAGMTGFGPAVGIVTEKGRSKDLIKNSNISPDIITCSRRLST